MQIFGYPGDRVDFVSKSGSAGSIMFGDSLELVQEFFGPAHTTHNVDESQTVITYFNSSLTLAFIDDKLDAITVTPHLSRERIEVFENKERLDVEDEASVRWAQDAQ